MAVEADMDEIGKPGLQTQMQQPKEGMLDIKVKVQALARNHFDVQHFGLVIALGLKSPARLHATEHANQALFDPIPVGHSPSLLFFGEGRAVEINERTPQ